MTTYYVVVEGLGRSVVNQQHVYSHIWEGTDV